jgi:FMN phosphatase YigB (HAD superfamily)
MAGATPDEAIYIGDSVSADVPGAHAAGIRAVWMNRTGSEWTGDRAPHLEIRDLYELLTALDLDG